MVRNYRKLQLLFKLTNLKLDQFFAVEIYDFELRLLARHDKELIKWCKNQKMEFEISNGGVLYFRKHRVEIAIM